MCIFSSKHSVRLALWAALVVLTGCGGSGETKPNDSTTNITTSGCDSCGGDCAELTATINDRHHTGDHVVYSEQPPVGGPHNPCWLPWTIDTSEPQTERWVHNLEHGGLAFLYNCPDGCDADVATLTTFVGGLPRGRAILLPYAEMPARFAAVAWGISRSMGCLDTSALQAFFTTHVEHSPEDTTADPPSSCPTP